MAGLRFPTLLLGLLLALPLPVPAVESDPVSSLFLLRRDDDSRFFDRWTRVRQQAAIQQRDGFPLEGLLMEGLLEAHTELDGDLRILRHPPERGYTLDRSNEAWLARAIALYRQHKWRESRDAIARLAPPLAEAIADRALFLRALLAIHADDGDTALGLLAQIPPGSDLTPQVRYNQALVQLQHGHLQQAGLSLRQLQQSTGDTPRDRRVRSYGRLLQARLEAHQGRLDRARKLLGTVHREDPLYIRARQTLVEILQLAGRQAAALPALLELSLLPTDGQLTLDQVRLMEALRASGAGRQALALGERLIPAQQAALKRLRQLATALASDGFYRQLAEGALPPLDPGMEALLSQQASALIGEIRHLHELTAQLRQTLALMPAYQPMFDKGRGHLQALEELSPGLLPSKIYQVPGEVRRESVEVREFERDLNELVGQPRPWGSRYDIFSGLTLWKQGAIPWRTAQGVDRVRALPALEQALKARRREIRALAKAQIQTNAERMRALEAQARDRLQGLEALAGQLLKPLQQVLQREAVQLMRQTEQQLLWLATQTLLPAAEIDNPQPQTTYNLSAGAGGEVRIKPLEDPPRVPASPAAYQALADLASGAYNRDVRLQALRTLADLNLASAERRLVSGEADPSGLDGSFEAAIDGYRRWLELGGDQPGADAVLYQLAHAQDLAGRLEPALATLEQLSRRFPDAPGVDEVLFRIAEMRFSLGDYEAAAGAYRTLVDRFPRSTFGDRATHKLGWSLFKLGEYDAALARFTGLLDRHWQRPDADRPLLDDLLRVTALSFANLNGIDSLQGYFAQREPPYLRPLYETLAGYYGEKARYHDTAATYQALLQRFPDTEDAPEYQARVVQAYTRGGFPSLAWPARETFVDRFGPDSRYWRQADAATQAQIRAHLGDYLLALAQRDHALAQQSNTPAAYDKPLHWYDQFIRALPASPDIARVRFLRGEALTERGDHRQAAEAYRRAAYDYPDFGRREEAGYAELLAYQRLYRDADGAERNRWLQQQIAQSRRYIDAFPTAKRRPQVLTKLAEDLLIQDDTRDALEIALRLSESADLPDPDLPLRIWRVIAHASFDLGEYARAENAYLTAGLLNPPPDEAARFRRRQAEAIYQQGEAAAQQGLPERAVNHYLRLGQAVPDAEIRPTAEFEAVRMLMKAEHWQRAIEQMERFRANYPGQPLLDTLPDKLVICYEQTRQWDRAAAELQRIFEREGDSPLGRDALWRSAALNLRAGRPRLAAAGYDRFIQTFPRPLDPTLEARLELLKLAEAGEIDRDPNTLRRQLIAAQDNAGPAATDRSRFLASEASLHLAHLALSAYDAIQLTAPLKDSLARKKAAMEAAVAALTKTSSYGLAEHSTEATVLIASLYSNLAKALMASERPEALDALAREQYDILLEEQAAPFEEKAIEIHELNLDRINQGVFTPAIAESLKKLRQLMPTRYDKAEVVDEVVEQIR